MEMDMEWCAFSLGGCGERQFVAGKCRAAKAAFDKSDKLGVHMLTVISHTY